MPQTRQRGLFSPIFIEIRHWPRTLRIVTPSGPTQPCERLNADPRSTPPCVHVCHDRVLSRTSSLVQHGAQTTPELGVYVLPRALPPEVRVEEVVVFTHALHVFRELAWGREVVNVYEGPRRGREFVVLASCTHHNWNDVIPVDRYIYTT